MPDSRPQVRERFDSVEGRRIRTLTLRAAEHTPGRPPVVIVPGMGALGYLTRLMEALSARGASSTLLDLPGFGSRQPLACAPQVPVLARTAAGWLASAGPTQPVVLVGHSTGAQVALGAAAQLNNRSRLAGLVLCGPTMAPTQRSWFSLARAASTAYRYETPGELRVARDFARAGPKLLTMLRTALADRPEQTIAGVTVPVLVTAGRADTLAGEDWLHTLVRAAGGPSQVRLLPGSHNNPWTHPEELAELVLSVSP